MRNQLPTPTEQRPLPAVLAWLGALLRRHSAGARGDVEPMPALPALERIAATPGLSPFEQATLLLCAGVELDSGIAGLVAEAQGDPAARRPGFSLALAALPGAHWSALTPEGPLRRWRLVELEPGASPVYGPLRIDEQILHMLAGLRQLHPRLAPLATPVPPTGRLAPSQLAAAGRLGPRWLAETAPHPLSPSPTRGEGESTHGAQTVSLLPPTLAEAGRGHDGNGHGRASGLPSPARGRGAGGEGHSTHSAHPGDPSTGAEPSAIPSTALRAGGYRLSAIGYVTPVLLLEGDDPPAARGLLAAACAGQGRRLYALDAALLPLEPAALAELAALWSRESLLNGAALLLDCHELDQGDPERGAAVRYLAERVEAPLAIAGPPPALERPTLTLHVAPPELDERRALWRAALGPASERLNGRLDQVAAQFSLGAAAIEAAAGAALAMDAPLEQAVWTAGSQQARPRLAGLARRVEPVARWDDLVLPAAQRESLRAIVEQARGRARVLGAWGFGGRGGRGLGLSALFAGASGTGKTMAAEVIAHELGLDLYVVDLATVISKYIGETEKQLRRIFDAAEAGGAVLLFDEADALFGKRSEVKDSHDRYANLEVSYLLQRIEAYRGVAILTTNLRQALDSAFLRRLSFVVSFPFPGAEQREQIWRRAFPPQTPTEGLDYAQLARLNVAGGSIAGIARAAAYLAAGADEPVRMAHLLRAARLEFAKLDKPLPEAEVAGWGADSR